jgi:hypothetical protein
MKKPAGTSEEKQVFQNRKNNRQEKLQPKTEQEPGRQPDRIRGLPFPEQLQETVKDQGQEQQQGPDQVDPLVEYDAHQPGSTPEQYPEASGAEDLLQPEKPDAPVLSPVTETEPVPPVPPFQEEDRPDLIVPFKRYEARDHQLPLARTIR